MDFLFITPSVGLIRPILCMRQAPSQGSRVSTLSQKEFDPGNPARDREGVDPTPSAIQDHTQAFNHSGILPTDVIASLTTHCLFCLVLNGLVFFRVLKLHRAQPYHPTRPAENLRLPQTPISAKSRRFIL